MMIGDCTCIAPIMLREGKLCCSRCDRPLIEQRDEAAGEYSSYRLPPDAKNVEAFNSACRGGRVEGAVKRGRAWVASREAWNNRKGMTPSIPRRLRKAEAPRPVATNAEGEILRKMGIVVMQPKRTA